MATPSERRRNNIRAGLFVTAAIILSVIVVVILSGAWDALTSRTDRYRVQYPVSAGVANLRSGSDVRVGGVVMGRVASVKPILVRDQPFERIEVVFAVDERVTLYADAEVSVSSPLLGTEAWLSVSSVGHPEAGPPAPHLEGRTAPGMLASMLGPETADRAARIVANASEFSEFLTEVPEIYRDRVEPALEDVGATTAEVRALAERVNREDWPRWAGRVDEVMTWAGGFTQSLDQAVSEGNALFADARDVIGDNREKIDSIVDDVAAASADVQALAERARTELADKVAALLDTGQGALDSAQATIEALRQDYPAWSTDLGEALGNANLAAQQLKLTTVEVRRSPWKVLYRPSDRELEHELLYGAARSFALAAADLKAASTSVERMLELHGDRLEEDPRLLERLRGTLLEPLGNYEVAQQRLLEVLFEE